MIFWSKIGDSVVNLNDKNLHRFSFNNLEKNLPKNDMIQN